MTLTGPSRAYYEAKALKSKLSEIPFSHDFCIISDANTQGHLLYSKSNKDSLQSFTDRLVSLKNELTALLSQQTVLMLRTQADTLKRIESKLAGNREFYAAVSDENEDRATAFVTSHGGVEVVQMVSAGLVILSIPFHLIAGFRMTVFWNNWLQQ